MTDNDLREEVVFADESVVIATSRGAGKAWKLLVVDDEEEVHSITRMVLAGFEFEGVPLEFLSAYSGEEARRILAEHPDVAVMLLDVVMETPHAGLELARHVREELGNRLVRIILRTGQPGQAPERQVIIEYDINDYKNKSELTAQKLFTAVTTGIRSHRDLLAIDRSREGLEDIIAASADLFRTSRLDLFARGVLTQMTSLLRLEESSLYLGAASGFAAQGRFDDFVIIAGTGEFAGKESKLASDILDEHDLTLIRRAARAAGSIFERECYAGCFGQEEGRGHVLFLRIGRELSDLERSLVRIFAANAAVAFENLLLNHEMVETHREVIFTLGEVVENRALIEGMHVHRVAEMAYLMASLYGLSGDECELLRLAMPMHDVGKVAIPDRVLLKNGPLDEAEQRIIREHPRLGFEILNGSANRIMKAAARIALEHQESWDGSGYPAGLRGEEIHIFSRISRVVDVLDSLLSERVYKTPWSANDALEYVRAQRGVLFDPSLVDVLFEHQAELLALRENILQQGRELKLGENEKKS
jgi:response regulator RpfG family c-di-GMP phosphodiesterase